MILYLTVALIVLFVGYVGIVTWKYGVLHSISRSFYTLRELGKGYWFRILMFTSGLLLILIAAYYGSEHSWALYTSGIGAILTGAAAMYLDKITGIVHYISSAVMLIGVIVFIGLIYTWALLVLAFAGLAIAVKYRKTMPNPVYWYEVYAFSISLITLLHTVLTFIN